MLSLFLLYCRYEQYLVLRNECAVSWLYSHQFIYASWGPAHPPSAHKHCYTLLSEAISELHIPSHFPLLHTGSQDRAEKRGL